MIIFSLSETQTLDRDDEQPSCQLDKYVILIQIFVSNFHNQFSSNTPTNIQHKTCDHNLSHTHIEQSGAYVYKRKQYNV